MNKTIILGMDGWYPQVDGVTNVVLNYHNILKQGNRCVIVAPSYGKKNDVKGEAEYCAEVFHNRSAGVPFLSFRNSMPGSDRKLKRTLDELKPDILHAHSPFAICSYFIKYGKKHNVPVVFTFHTKYRDEFLRVTHSRLATAIMMKVIMRNINRVRHVWAVSENAAGELRSYGYKRDIKVMRNGTEMTVADNAEISALSEEFDREYGTSPNERVFVYAGRVVGVKNLGFSFEVIAELKRRGFNCKFFIVGSGDELEAHKKLASKAGVSDEVIFTGFIGERAALRKIYARADLFLLPSTFDTFGLVILEAASCRTPSFVPENSCAAELIKDNVTGYAERLDVKLWADRIEKMFGDGNYDKVCENCTSIVAGWNEVVAAAENEYDSIIEASRSADR